MSKNRRKCDTKQSFLTMTGSGRWAIVAAGEPEVELTSGDFCEVLIAGLWIGTRIESRDGQYYAVVTGIRLLEGLPARLP